MSNATSGGGGGCSSFIPKVDCTPLADCKGTWKLLVAKNDTDGAQQVTRVLQDAKGFDIAPGVQRANGPCLSFLAEVDAEKKEDAKVRGVVWGAVMKDRKNVPWLAVGGKDGNDVALVVASKVKLIPAEARRLGAAWPSEAAFDEASGRACAAIDQAVVQMAQLAEKRESETAAQVEEHHLTRQELADAATAAGYELVTPYELAEEAKRVQEWKDIAASKEREIAVLKEQVRELKKASGGAENTGTNKRSRAEDEMLTDLEAKVDHLTSEVGEIKKMVKKTYKKTKATKRAVKYKK
jgi:hypothetical protein